MDVFNRKIDLNICADNFVKEIDFLSNKENSFEDFKEMIKRNASIGKIESDHIRPFIWKIMLDEKNWKNKKNLEEIIQDFHTYNKQYNNKLKSTTHKKKFKKDPLANSSDENWKQVFQNIEVKKILDLDLIRTYPDKPLFQQESIKQIITNTILIWSQENSDLSYRQGMNEIVAVIIYSIYPYYFLDSELEETITQDKIKELIPDKDKNKKDIYRYLFNKKTFEPDVFLIFDLIMKNGLKDLYETSQGNGKEENQNKMNYKYYDLFAFKCENEEINDNSKFKNRCDVIIKEKLKKIDRDLYNHFLKIDINCIVFLQKWLKCLFNREFSNWNVIIIWDNIIAEGNKNLDFVDFISIAILEKIKKNIFLKDQDELFQEIFNLKNKDISALEIISSAIELQNQFNNESKAPAKKTKTEDSFTFSKKTVYASTPGSFSTPNQIINSSTNNISQQPPQTQSISNKEISTTENNLYGYQVPNFKSYFSKIGSFIKDVVSVEPQLGQTRDDSELISFYPKDVADNVAHLEYFLQKSRQYLSKEEIFQFEATVRFFKLGGMSGNFKNK